MDPLLIFGIVVLLYLGLVFLVMKAKFSSVWIMPMTAALILVVVAIFRGSIVFNDINTVFMNGSYALGASIMGYVFSGAYAAFLSEAGVIPELIKRAAELGGDSRKTVTILVGLAVAATGMVSGQFLGLVIAVPILLNIGISRKTTAILMGSAAIVSTLLMPGNWATYTAMFKYTMQDFMGLTLVLTAIAAVFWIVMAWIRVHRDKEATAWSVEGEEPEQKKKVPLYLLIGPFLPIGLMIFTTLTAVPACIISLLFMFLLIQINPKTRMKETAKVFTKSFFDGINLVAIMISVFAGIGIVQAAVKIEAVSKVFSAALTAIIPTEPTAMSAVILLILICFAGWRGPGSPQGLGAAIVIALTTIPGIPAMVPCALYMTMNVYANFVDPTTGVVTVACGFAKYELTGYYRKMFFPTIILGVGLMIAFRLMMF